jgi:hypothetical protein
MDAAIAVSSNVQESNVVQRTRRVRAGGYVDERPGFASNLVLYPPTSDSTTSSVQVRNPGLDRVVVDFRADGTTTLSNVVITGTMNAGWGGLGTAVVQDLRHPNSNIEQYTGLPWGVTYVTRPLNTIDVNTNSNVLGLSNNNIWVAPGTYLVTCQGTASATSNGVARSPPGYVLVNNSTGASNRLLAMADTVPSGWTSASFCWGQAIVQASSPSNAFVFAQYCSNVNMQNVTGSWQINSGWLPTLSNTLSTVTLQRLA